MKEIDAQNFVMRFQYNGKTVPLGYPSGDDGIYFMETGVVQWALRLNELILSHENATLSVVLTYMLEFLEKEKKGILTRSMEDTQV